MRVASGFVRVGCVESRRLHAARPARRRGAVRRSHPGAGRGPGRGPPRGALDVKGRRASCQPPREPCPRLGPEPRAPSPEPRNEGRLARLGRLRAVLRLGERPHARPARRAVLAADDRRRARPGAGAGLRHGPGDDAARARRRRTSSASIARREMLARARRRVRRQRRGVAPGPGARRRPPPAVPRRGVPDGDGALRHPAVAAVGTRPEGDARRRGPRGRARRHLRPRAGRRSARRGASTARRVSLRGRRSPAAPT